MLLRRNRLLLCSFLFVLLCSSLVVSVDAASTWQNTYGGNSGEGAYSIVETPDGGYALAGVTSSFGAGGGDAWLVKTDLAGNMQWSRTYGEESFTDIAFSLVATSDGGYALGGVLNGSIESGDFWLIKTDESGIKEWSKTYGGAGSDEAFSLVQASDGGYALAGYTGSFGAGGNDFWLVKTDAAGNMQWNKTYGGAGFDFPRSLVATSDGGYAIAGMTHHITDEEIEFPILLGNADQTYEGGDATNQTYYLSYEVFWLVKTDALGNVEWNQTYGEKGQSFAYSVIETSDGGFALAGYTTAFGAGSFDFWLVKTDEFGNIEWNQTYGGTDFEIAKSLVATSDGGFAMAGVTWSFSAGEGDFWLVKTDMFGNMEWNQTYGGIKDDSAWSLVATSDGGFAMAGVTYSFPAAGFSDVWFIKTDEDGVAPEAAWVILPLMLVATVSIFICKKKLLPKRSQVR